MIDMETTAMKAEILTEQMIEMFDEAKQASPPYKRRLLGEVRKVKERRDSMLQEAM